VLPEESARILADWINKLSPDVYVISVSPDIGWLALPFLSTDIACLCIGHTDAPTFYNPARHYRPLLTTAIGVSDTVCEHYTGNDGFDTADVSWIPYGVEPSETPPVPDNSKIIKMIYVGRLDEGQKRVSDLVEVMKLLSLWGIPYHLQVVGDGPEMPAIKEKLRTETEKGKVKLTGWLTPAEVLKLLRQSEVFLLTSAFEGFCIALTEAMANGCCPVVTDIRSGNKQLITHNESGYMLPVGDINSFAEIISELQKNKALLAAKREAAWLNARQYDTTRMIRAYEEVFLQALEKIKGTPRKNQPDFPVMESCKSSYPVWMRRIKYFLRQNKLL